MNPRMILLALAAALLVGGDAFAQEARRPPGDPSRQTLEARVRERFATAVQRRLALSDDQVAKLRETNARLEGRRRDVARTERETRMALRRELMRGDSADQEAVRRGTETLIRLRREQVTLLEEESKALGEFLTPVQRARYFAMQEELRMRMNEMRRGQGGMRGAPGGRGMREGRRPPLPPPAG